jgi:hypothetical protein
MVTILPTGPLNGVTELIVGEFIQVKVLRDALPSVLETTTVPLAPAPTFAVMLFGELTV